MFLDLARFDTTTTISDTCYQIPKYLKLIPRCFYVRQPFFEIKNMWFEKNDILTSIVSRETPVPDEVRNAGCEAFNLWYDQRRREIILMSRPMWKWKRIDWCSLIQKTSNVLIVGLCATIMAFYFIGGLFVQIKDCKSFKNQSNI